MFDLTDNEKAVLLLASRVADSRARALAPGEWAGLRRRLVDSAVSPADLWDASVIGRLGLDSETAERGEVFKSACQRMRPTREGFELLSDLLGRMRIFLKLAE